MVHSTQRSVLELGGTTVSYFSNLPLIPASAVCATALLHCFFAARSCHDLSFMLICGGASW